MSWTNMWWVWPLGQTHHNLLNAFVFLGLFLQGDMFPSSSAGIFFTDVADAPVALTVISTSAFLVSEEFSVLKWLNTLIIIVIFPVVRASPFIAYLPDLKDNKTSRTKKKYTKKYNKSTQV